MAKLPQTYDGPPKPDDKPQRDRGVIISDPEMRAMAQISKALGKLDEAARERVLTWLQSRWSFPIVDQTQRSV